MFRPEMLRPMGLPEDVNVIAWGLSLVGCATCLVALKSGLFLQLCCGSRQGVGGRVRGMGEHEPVIASHSSNHRVSFVPAHARSTSLVLLPPYRSLVH